MSTPPKSDAKAAAKRRALARRRNREILRHIFAYGIIAILVLGTVSTVLVQTASAPPGTVVPSTPTTPDSNGFDQLLTRGRPVCSRQPVGLRNRAIQGLPIAISQ